MMYYALRKVFLNVYQVLFFTIKFRICAIFHNFLSEMLKLSISGFSNF